MIDVITLLDGVSLAKNEAKTVKANLSQLSVNSQLFLELIMEASGAPDMAITHTIASSENGTYYTPTQTSIVASQNKTSGVLVSVPATASNLQLNRWFNFSFDEVDVAAIDSFTAKLIIVTP